MLTFLFARRKVGPKPERWYHPKPNLRVTWAVGDLHPFRVVLCQAYRGLFAPDFQCCYFCESSCLFCPGLYFDFYVSKIMHL